MWLNYNWGVAPSCTLICMIGHVDTATLTSPGSKKRCSCCRLANASVCFFLKSPNPYTSTNLAVCTSQEPQEPKEQPQPCQTIYIFLTRIGYRGYRPPLSTHPYRIHLKDAMVRSSTWLTLLPFQLHCSFQPFRRRPLNVGKTDPQKNEGWGFWCYFGKRSSQISQQ